MGKKYLNQRVEDKTVKRLRRYERKHYIGPSISGTIEHLLYRADQSDQKEGDSDAKT